MIRYEEINLNFGLKPIFNNFSLGITRGQKVAILGKSGLGKSSLFALLLGFVRPQSGRIFFDGAPVNERSVWHVRRRVSFVDQDVSIGDYKMSEWFAFVAGMKTNHPADFGEEKVKELMDFFELSRDLLNEDISALSGGERQRAAIIVSVLLKRDVFLLDEVTSALDKNLKQKTADFFMGRKDWTVVAISHDAVWLEDPHVKVFDLEKNAWKR
ncbi:MAG: ATP-binding cassette domain-containing protein [Candidatus Omnitrophica bacterium]|nr:ATP-binding cassette domain-containing protein [Candidatus Omnitrophota bacterium]HQP12815.1 ATP-binding cassette domain-containing protein [Candidatus Omnitrophota bacterium]